MIYSLRLQNFRSYVDDSFELNPGVNIIVGPNASGKTNLLEAIMVVALGKSYRSKDDELVRFSAPWARLEGHTAQEDRIVRLEAGSPGVKKTFELNTKLVHRLTQAKTLPLVIFEPNHLLFLTGQPQLRRDFLDDLLEQTLSGFGTIRRQYRRTLAQRNALLKLATVPSGELFAWNVRLSELGGQIARSRQQLLSQLQDGLGRRYSQLAGHRSQVTLHYHSVFAGDTYSSHFLTRLEQQLAVDQERGFTTYGPHRDDLLIELNGHPLQEIASRGETRTLLLALKMSEAELVKQVRDQAPLLLLDDVFSELDGKRRQALTKFLRDYQTFITTTDADVVVQHFLEHCHIIPIQKNK